MKRGCICGAHVVDLITLIDEIAEGLKIPNYFSADDKYFMRLGLGFKPTLLQIQGPDGKPLSDEAFKELFHFDKPLEEGPDLFRILEDVQTGCEISTKEDSQNLMEALKQFGSDNITAKELREHFLNLWHNIGTKLMDCAVQDG